jgi:hypothetical protein
VGLAGLERHKQIVPEHFDAVPGDDEWYQHSPMRSGQNDDAGVRRAAAILKAIKDRDLGAGSGTPHGY